MGLHEGPLQQIRGAPWRRNAANGYRAARAQVSAPRARHERSGGAAAAGSGAVGVASAGAGTGVAAAAGATGGTGSTNVALGAAVATSGDYQGDPKHRPEHVNDGQYGNGDGESQARGVQFGIFVVVGF